MAIRPPLETDGLDLEARIAYRYIVHPGPGDDIEGGGQGG
jgi:hypothetical protein